MTKIMAEGGYRRAERDIGKISRNLLGRRITDLSCYHQILQKLGVNLYTDIRGEEGNWERLAEELGIQTYNEVENIHRHASREKVFPGSVLLKRWGENDGSTVYVLLQALRKLGREDCVEDVCKALEDENTMELHYSIEDSSGVKEFDTVKTKKDSTLGASLENALQGLVCYDIIGPDSFINWNTQAVNLKGKQLSLKKVAFDIDRHNSLYGQHGCAEQQQYQRLPSEASWDPSVMYPMFPTNIPISDSSFRFVNTSHSVTPTFCDNRRNNGMPNNSGKKDPDEICNSITQPKVLHSVDPSCVPPVLRHSKSIEDSNFHSQTDIKKYEKNIPVTDSFEDNTCLKKCNSLSDMFYDTDLLKKRSSVISMDTSELITDCTRPDCHADKCTHGLVWQNGQVQSINSCHSKLNTSDDNFMDTKDSLEIFTPTGNSSVPDDFDYVPHSNIVALKRHSEGSCSPGSPSPTKVGMEQTLVYNAAMAAQKPGDNKSQSLLRTALRRSFEKKKTEIPPKPCNISPVQAQQNDIYFNSLESDPCISDQEEDAIHNIEKELSKRPPQCRLPVSSDGYIAMDSHGVGSESRPCSLPLESTYMNMNGTAAQHIARRPLPPRPTEIVPYHVTNLMHSHSMGDMIVNNQENQYTSISSEDTTPSPLTSPDARQQPPIKKRSNASTAPLVRSHSTTAVPDLTNVPGWCASITQENVKSTMSKYKNEDGNFMVWRMENNTFVITVSHLRDLRHYAIHSRLINDAFHYYIFNGGFVSTSISDLVHHYQKEGLKGPDPVMLEGGRGKKWQNFLHVKLKHPMKSKTSSKKD